MTLYIERSRSQFYVIIFNSRYITPEKFYIEAIGSGNELLAIDRVSQEISLQGVYSSQKCVCVEIVIQHFSLPVMTVSA